MATYTDTTTGTTSPVAYDTFYTALETILLGEGWTLFQTTSNVQGTRQKVYKSAERTSGVGDCAFVEIKQTSTTTFNITVGRDADSSAGLINPSSSSTMTLQTADFSYVIRANGWAFACIARCSTRSMGYGGFCRRALPSYRAGITKATGSLSAAATSIAVANDMTGQLTVGQKIQIHNYAHNNASANKNKGETVTITSIAAGSIGVSALANAYDTGALIGEKPYNAIALATTSSLTSPSAGNQPDGFGTSAVAMQVGYQYISPNQVTTGEPAGAYYTPGPLGVHSTDATHGGYFGYLYHMLGVISGAATDDLFDDGAHTFIVGLNSSNTTTCIQKT